MIDSVQQGVQLDMSRTRPVSSMEALNYQQMCNCCLVGNTGLLPMDPSSGEGFLITKEDNARLGVVTDEDTLPAESSEQTIAERARKIAEDRLRQMRASEAFATIPFLLILVIAGIVLGPKLVQGVQALRARIQGRGGAAGGVAEIASPTPVADAATATLITPAQADMASSGSMAMNFFA